MKRGIIMNKADNVATVLDDVPVRETVASRGLAVPVETVAREAIPRGHKIALADIPAGADILKYGFPSDRPHRHSEGRPCSRPQCRKQENRRVGGC